MPVVPSPKLQEWVLASPAVAVRAADLPVCAWHWPSDALWQDTFAVNSASTGGGGPIATAFPARARQDTLEQPGGATARTTL